MFEFINILYLLTFKKIKNQYFNNLTIDLFIKKIMKARVEIVLRGYNF